MDLLSTPMNIAMILLGFGLLIFVHEMGHFLAARWAGIRCESFAIGMGPPVLAFRPGVGWALGSTDPRCISTFGKAALEMSDEELRANGVGETEYSLRALPLGGFVRMLGQDDLNPSESSSHIRGYQRAPIWKRMIVISAGVTANTICAMVLFVVAFLHGVDFEAPVVGGVVPGSPAAAAGMMPGDTIVEIDGARILTFSDIQIATAMGPAASARQVTVSRPGEGAQREFSIVPTYDAALGMQVLGVMPARTLTLLDPRKSDADAFRALVESGGLDAETLPAGSSLVSLDGRPVDRFEQLQAAVVASDGTPLDAEWRAPDGRMQRTTMVPIPALQQLSQMMNPSGSSKARGSQFGLLGMVPMVRVAAVPADSPNRGVLQAGDLIVRAGTAAGPSLIELNRQLLAREGGTIPLSVVRNGKEMPLQARVSSKATLGFVATPALETTQLATPMDLLAPESGTPGEARESAVAPLELLPLSRITHVNQEPVANWAELRASLQRATARGAAAGQPTSIQLSWQMPTPGREAAKGSISVSAADARALQDLGWQTQLTEGVFAPMHVTLQADGDPVKAVAMGLRQTYKMIEMTYLTLNGLFRGNVSMEQLRGPVGIVHLGTFVADRGFMYLVFFLAVISVNLAVLNFLPLPIVDGGLFLYLVYERFTGKPPSAAFQNIAIVVGLCLLGGIFLITFYNDVMRLLGT